MLPLDIWIHIVSYLGMRDAISLYKTHSLFQSLPLEKVNLTEDIDGFILWTLFHRPISHGIECMKQYAGHVASSTLIKACEYIMKLSLTDKQERLDTIMPFMDMAGVTTLLQVLPCITLNDIHYFLTVGYQQESFRLGPMSPLVRLKYIWQVIPSQHLLSLLQQPDYHMFFIKHVRYLKAFIQPGVTTLHPFVQHALDHSTLAMLHKHDPHSDHRHTLALQAMDQQFTLFQSLLQAGWIDTRIRENTLVWHAVSTGNTEAFLCILHSMKQVLNEKEYDAWRIELVRHLVRQGDLVEWLDHVIQDGLDPTSHYSYPWVLACVYDRPKCMSLLHYHPRMMASLGIKWMALHVRRVQHTMVIQCCTQLVSQSVTWAREVIHCIVTRGRVSLIERVFSHPLLKSLLDSIHFTADDLSNQSRLNALLHHSMPSIQSYYQNIVYHAILSACHSNQLVSLNHLLSYIQFTPSQVVQVLHKCIESSKSQCLDRLFQHDSFVQGLKEYAEFPIKHPQQFMDLVQMGIPSSLQPWIHLTLDWIPILDQAMKQGHVDMAMDIVQHAPIACITLDTVLSACTWYQPDLIMTLLSHPKLLIHPHSFSTLYQCIQDPHYDEHSILCVVRRLQSHSWDWQRMALVSIESKKYSLLEFILKECDDELEKSECRNMAIQKDNTVALFMIDNELQSESIQ